MTPKPFDDLMSKLSAEAEQLQTAELAQQVRQAKRERIRNRVFTVLGVGVFASLIYFQAEIRARVTDAFRSTEATVASTGQPTGAEARKAKLHKTAVDAQEQAALVDSIMDNAPDDKLGKVGYKSPGSLSDPAADGTTRAGSLKTAIFNAKNHAALIDGIMDDAPSSNLTKFANSLAPAH